MLLLYLSPWPTFLSCPRLRSTSLIMNVYHDVQHCMYTFIMMNLWICTMYMLHTLTWINIFVYTWYIHVYKCKYMYERNTDTSVQLHNHTLLSIRPVHPGSLAAWPCDACLGESQLRAGSAPSEQPPSCHQSSQLKDHPGAACHDHIVTATSTGLPSTN